jgi:hypothetical protein
MRLFQNSGLNPAYRPRLKALRRGLNSFQKLTDAFLDDRYGASHILLPVLNHDADAFFTNGDDEVAQCAWAAERGMRRSSSMTEILLAQIEEHRTEIFYNLDPVRYDSSFLRKMPGTVRRSIAWRAAPLAGADLSAYDCVGCNFPSIRQEFKRQGLKVFSLFPAHDPVLDCYATRTERPIDVLFVGGYSRHHMNRVTILDRIAEFRDIYRIVFALDRSKVTRFAESFIGNVGMSRFRRPRNVRAVSTEPVFGRQFYELLSRSKVVLNGAIDMAGDDRGNMRCWEALGGGCLLLSDVGNYPDGFVSQVTMVTYNGADDCANQAQSWLTNTLRLREVAISGNAMIRERYSKNLQWDRFQELASQ